MLRNLTFLFVAGAIALGIGYANQSTVRTILSVPKTPANSGKLMYQSYCAPCHGANARGNGPMAASLKEQPADLAMLSRKNGGKYPTMHVMAVLQFGANVSARGMDQMPVWGPVLARLDGPSTPSETRDLRINNLSRYLKSIQVQ